MINSRQASQDLATFRLQRILDLVRFSAAETKIGKERLRVLCSGDKLDLENWKDVRPLQKHEIMQRRSACVAQVLPAEAGQPFDGWTAGTTGQPLHYLNTELSSVADQLLNQRFFEDWSLDPGSTLAQIGIERGSHRQQQGSGWHLGSRVGKWVMIPVNDDPDTQLDKLVSLKPAVLKLYPLSLTLLIQRARERKLKLHFQSVISGGNIVTPEMREDCRDVFGCEIADTYGAEEVGNIALQCHICGQLHVSEEAVLLEVVKENGEPAEAGEAGRTIVTPFYNFAMPLVRYDLEDHVQRGDSSMPCARGRMTLTKVRGRSTSAFRLADGKINWPFVPASAVFALGNVKHFQFVQTAPDHVEFRYVPHDASRGIELAPVQAIVDQHIHESLKASVVPVEKIPRESDMKYMLFRGLPGAQEWS